MAANSERDRPRELDEMVAALKRHLHLLEDFAHKVYVEGDDDYAGEIAGKLRLLVTKFRMHTPLLLELMKKTGIEPRIILGGPPIQREPGKPRPGDEITLSEYLELDAFGIRVPSGDFVMLNKITFIRAWAEQTGSAHEDWEMDPALSAILASPIYIGGIHGALAELRITTEVVIHVARRFLSQWEQHKR